MKPTPKTDDSEDKPGKATKPLSGTPERAADAKADAHSKGWRNSGLNAPE
jgi:hypothetical protein